MEINRKALEERLRDLQTDYDGGLKQLRNLEERMTDLKQTLLRVSGAMQVLRELLDETPPNPQQGTGPGENGAGLSATRHNGELAGR